MTGKERMVIGGVLALVGLTANVVPAVGDALPYVVIFFGSMLFGSGLSRSI